MTGSSPVSSISDNSTLLVVALDDVRIGVATSAVLEILRAVAITALSGAPPVIEGVINVRGELVPLFDLRLRFGLPPVSLHPSQHLVVARASSRTVAFRVDRAEELVTVSDAQVASVSGRVSGAGHIEGVAMFENGMVLIHDLDTFLSHAESASLDRALAANE